jgi:rRNA biogenesis protein RRP5
MQATVIHVDGGKHVLDLSLHGSPVQLVAGSKALGRVASVSGAGVTVQLSAHASGKAALADVHDGPVDNALRGLQAGQWVQVALIEQQRGEASAGKGTKAGKTGKAGKAGSGSSGSPSHWVLSLRQSDGGRCAAHGAAQQADTSEGGEVEGSIVPPGTKASQLAANQQVGGYVKAAGKAGVFVCLTRTLDARLRLGQLSDKFVEDPAAAYPEGAYVSARVLKVEGERCVWGGVTEHPLVPV